MSSKRSAAATEDPTEGPTQKRAKTEANAIANNTNGNGNGNGSGNGGMGEWTKVEKRKKKKQNKKEALSSSGGVGPGGCGQGVGVGGHQFKAVTHPRFLYANQEILRRNHAIAIDDVRDLVLHLVADGPPPNWLRVDNAKMIQKVVTLLVPGLTPELLSLPPLPTSATVNPNLPISIPLQAPAPAPVPPLPSPATPSVVTQSAKGSLAGLAASIPFIASTFSHACPTRAPGDQTRMHSVLSSFFTGPVSGEERKKRIAQRVMLSEANKSDPMRYVLSVEQMIENDYPVPSYMADVFEKPPGWVETPEPKASENKGQRKIYAIDCEMCLTEDGKELTRVCVIDFHTGQVVYDQLVKPEKPIVDYLTRWSGITAEQLANVTTRHAEVQARIMQLLSPTAPPPNPFSTPTSTSTPSSQTQTQTPPPTPILLGHSLESDLKTLKITHPFCIDTALIFHHPRGKPLKPGLAWLTKKWCGREIQTRGEGGHDPEEDARACIELLRKKMENGPGFGEFKMDYESIFERMGRVQGGGGGAGGAGAGGVKSAVVDVGNPGVMHGSKATTAIGCKSDEEVLEGVLGAVPAHDFVFGRFMGLANVLGWVTPKGGNNNAPEQESATATTATTTTTTTTPSTTFEIPPSSTLTPVLETLNKHLKAVHDALPPRTALVIFTGHSDPRRMAALNARKMAFEQALKAGTGNNGPALPAGVSWSAQDGRDLEEAVEHAKRGLMFLGVKN